MITRTNGRLSYMIMYDAHKSTKTQDVLGNRMSWTEKSVQSIILTNCCAYLLFFFPPSPGEYVPKLSPAPSAYLPISKRCSYIWRNSRENGHRHEGPRDLSANRSALGTTDDSGSAHGLQAAAHLLCALGLAGYNYQQRTHTNNFGHHLCGNY